MKYFWVFTPKNVNELHYIVCCGSILQFSLHITLQKWTRLPGYTVSRGEIKLRVYGYKIKIFCIQIRISKK